MLRKMNDELNIPHCIKHYGEGGLPAENGIVPEDEFLKNFTILQLMLFLMPVQVLILVSLVRKRWRNFSSAATMIQKLIFKYPLI